MTDRREAILKAAETLLQHYGPQKTTVADIAGAANVGVGTVYLEFKNKDEIIEALACLRHDAVLGAMEAAATSDAPYELRFAAIFDARFECALRLCAGGVHASDLIHCSCPGVEASFALYQRREHELLARFFREAQSRGALEMGDPEGAATTVLLAYDGFSAPRLFDGLEGDHRRRLTELHHLILRGLLPR